MTLKEDQGIRIDAGLVYRTNELLKDFTYHLDHNPDVDGELRVKMAKAELCLFKVASLMQTLVEERKKSKVDMAMVDMLLKEPMEPYVMSEGTNIVVSVDK